MCRDLFGDYAAIDYRAPGMAEAIDAVCPNGANVDFDNTSGAIRRVVACVQRRRAGVAFGDDISLRETSASVTSGMGVDVLAANTPSSLRPQAVEESTARTTAAEPRDARGAIASAYAPGVETTTGDGILTRRQER